MRVQGALLLLASVAVLAGLPLVKSAQDNHLQVVKSAVAHSRKAHTLGPQHGFSIAKAGTQLEEGDTEDDGEEKLPVSIVIFFLIGFSIMTFLSMTTLNLAIRFDGAGARGHGTLFHYIVFMVFSFSAFTYFSMWTQDGVMHVEEADGEERILFPAWYLDWAFTTPLLLLAVALYGNVPFSGIVPLIGSDLMMIGCLWLGATISEGHMFFWWSGAAFFYCLTVYLLMVESCKATKNKVPSKDVSSYIALTTVLAIGLGAIPVMWLVGQEGTGVADLHAEVAIQCSFDVVCKCVMGALLLTAPATSSASEPLLRKAAGQSSTYV